MLARSSRKLLSVTKTHHAKCINLEHIRTAFYYKYRHGPTKISEGEPNDYKEWIKEFFSRKGYEFIKDEFRRYFLDKPFRTTIQKYAKFDETVVFEHFDKEDSFEKWKVAADSDTFNGYSTAKLSRSVDGHALFHGFLDNRVPDDGATTNSGFVSLIGSIKERDSVFKYDNHWDWSKFNCLEIRFRGDGRRYTILCNVSNQMDDQSYFDTYSLHLYTRGGPYWETRRIPFSKLVFSSETFVQDEQYTFPAFNVKFFAIALEDSVDGPFNLEIDYVGLRLQTGPILEINAHEHYSFAHIQLIRLQVGCAPPDPEGG